MTMESLILSPRYGDPRDSTSLSLALTFSYDDYENLADIVKVGEGYGTFNECSDCFSSATINSTLLDIQ